jgi:hypothetical protein
VASTMDRLGGAATPGEIATFVPSELKLFTDARAAPTMVRWGRDASGEGLTEARATAVEQFAGIVRP